MKSRFQNKALIALKLGWLFFSPALATSEAAPGDLDPTFDGTGKIRTGLGFGHDFGRAVAVQADGKMIVAGHAGGDEFLGSYVALVRYNTDNSLDGSFGSGGKVLTPMGSGITAGVTAIRPQGTDGKIVVAGYVLNASQHYDFLVLRYNPDGTLDTTFGGDGIVITDIGGEDLGKAMIVDANSRIIVTGSTDIPSGNTAMVRYNVDGSLDASFDGDGIVITPNSTGGNAVTLQSDGKIIVAGGSFSFVVARYNTNGSLDTSFGGGQVSTTIGTGSFESAKAVAIQSDPAIWTRIGFSWRVPVWLVPVLIFSSPLSATILTALSILRSTVMGW